jgi:putative membrane protein
MFFCFAPCIKYQNDRMLTQQLKNLHSYLRLTLTGFIMGAADIVPGVSGGTIAFIFGIYEELIYSIKTVSGEVLRLLVRGKIKEALAEIPFGFLIPLGIGILTALLTLANVLSYVLVAYPAFLWSFFFGLVIASILAVRKRVVTWDKRDYLAMTVTAVAAYFIVGAVPVETPNTLLAYFLAGAIAICAMILPGISGSFLLVIMGKYEQVLGAVTDRNFLILGVFMLGCVIGLAAFSRLLSWMFARHHDIIVASLIGFMIGSLRKIWPWKEVISTRINSHGEVVPFQEVNILPASLDTSVILSLLLCAIGVAAILFLEKLQVTKEQTSDIEDKDFKREHTKAIKSQMHD